MEFWKLEIKFGNKNFDELFKDENLKINKLNIDYNEDNND